jgi:drug/metabolite transporter (DMT)-like permease
VFGRYVLPAVSPTLLTALRIVGALPLLAVLAVSTASTTGIALPTAEQWPRLVLIALIPGLLGLLLYYRGLNHTPASLATLGELCFPAAAAVLNWLFLGTEVSITQGFGVALLWLVVLWPRHQATSPE